MKRITPQWLLAGLLALGCLPVWAKSDAQPAADADPRLQVEATLDQKFDQGKYSPKGADTCLKCHDADSRKPATGIFHNVHGNLGNQNGPMADKQCEACHGPAGNHPHQSQNEASLKQPSLNESCYECHAEKRGPFLWEHEPVTEDCSLCHSPHGSINQALLNKRVPQLCQECHSVPHANVSIPEGDLKVRGGSCLNCHNQIHGTNHPNGQSLRR